MGKMATDQVADLLRNAGFVTSADGANAQQVALKTGLPVTRVLVMLGLVTPQLVQAACDAQELVKEQLITADTAVKALCIVSAQRVELEDALRQLGVVDDGPTNVSELGDLLLTAEVITEDQFADACNTSQHLGLPLGRILVLKGWLSEESVESVLEVQALMRDRCLNRIQALEALRTMRLSSVGIREALRRIGCENQVAGTKLRLGEMLVGAGLVSQSDLLTALEISLVESQPIGKALIDFGFIDERLLEAALKLQSMVNSCRLTPMQTSEALILVAQHNLSIVQAVSSVIEPEVGQQETGDLMHLLSLAGLLTGEDCERLLKFKGTSIFNVELLGSLISSTTLDVAIRCHILAQDGLLTRQQSIIALHHWRWSGVSLVDILENLGWADDGEIELPQLGDGLSYVQHQLTALQQSEAALTEALVAASSDRLIPAVEQRMVIKKPDQGSQLHHTWGVPEVHHTWGVPDLHHSWH